jgi:hypothetical protein
MKIAAMREPASGFLPQLANAFTPAADFSGPANYGPQGRPASFLPLTTTPTVGGDVSLQFSNGSVAGSWTDPATVAGFVGLGTQVANLFLNRAAPAQAPSAAVAGPALAQGTYTVPGNTIEEKMANLLGQAPSTPVTSTSSTMWDRRWYKKDGTPRRRKANGQPWKAPSMNITNPYALRRSMRRVEGFAALAKRTIRFTSKVKMKSKKRRG